MKFVATTALKKIAKLEKRIRAAQGGTSSGKTVDILLLLIAAAQTDKTPTLTSIVSETLPHLKKGAIRDFLSIMEGHGYFKEDRWNRTDFVYTMETGSKLEFFSADQPGKVRGPRRDRLFINEANNVPYEAFDQLEVRTKEYIYLDWNPTSQDFWFYTQVQQRGDAEVVITTYKDNEALPQEIVASIEQRKDNKNWFTVYGLGQVGSIEGRIYDGWNVIEDCPHEARLERRGLDWGYTNDPTAIVDIYKHDGGFILDESCYQRGMSNRQIADLLKNLTNPSTLVVADSAEPKSIDELRGYGISVVPASKGPGSVNQGIQFVQDQRISVTKRSVNLIKEYRNYLWQTDRNGVTLNVPEGGFDHALDAVRYAFSTLRTDSGDLTKERSIIQSLMHEAGLPSIA